MLPADGRPVVSVFDVTANFLAWELIVVGSRFPRRVLYFVVHDRVGVYQGVQAITTLFNPCDPLRQVVVTTPGFAKDVRLPP